MRRVALAAVVIVVRLVRGAEAARAARCARAMMVWDTGVRLGPFELMARRGADGAGDVWKARDVRLDRAVAIKRLRDPDARFVREALTIAALNHPHICTLHDVGDDYMVMELVDGVPLAGPLPPAEAVRLALQIAGALEAAHSHGIVHRDLKPANIVVSADAASCSTSELRACIAPPATIQR